MTILRQSAAIYQIAQQLTQPSIGFYLGLVGNALHLWCRLQGPKAKLHQIK